MHIIIHYKGRLKSWQLTKFSKIENSLISKTFILMAENFKEEYLQSLVKTMFAEYLTKSESSSDEKISLPSNFLSSSDIGFQGGDSLILSTA